MAKQIHEAHLGPKEFSGGNTFTGDHEGVEITIDEDWGYAFPLTSISCRQFIASQDGSTTHLENIIRYLVLSSFRDACDVHIAEEARNAAMTSYNIVRGYGVVDMIKTVLASQMDRKNSNVKKKLWMTLCCERMISGLASFEDDGGGGTGGGGGGGGVTKKGKRKGGRGLSSADEAAWQGEDSSSSSSSSKKSSSGGDYDEGPVLHDDDGGGGSGMLQDAALDSENI